MLACPSRAAALATDGWQTGEVTSRRPAVPGRPGTSGGAFKCPMSSPKAGCGSPAEWSVFSISLSVSPRAPAAVIARAVSMLNGEKNRLPFPSFARRPSNSPAKVLIDFANSRTDGRIPGEQQARALKRRGSPRSPRHHQVSGSGGGRGGPWEWLLGSTVGRHAQRCHGNILPTSLGHGSDGRGYGGVTETRRRLNSSHSALRMRC